MLPGPTPGTVYVGGAFNNIGGVKAKGLVLLNVSDGSRVAGFAALPMNGIVNTVARSGSRLFVGGTFTQIGGQTRGGIASMGAATGVVDSFMTSTVTVNHNWTPTNGGAKAGVGVSKIDITPDGSRLVAIGNFKFVDGLPRDQVAMWNLGATADLRTDWQTHRYEPACFSWAYDSYIRDVDFSPDGSYFVIVATGGGNGTLCDTAARFETDATGTDIQPTWVDYTGGDTVLSVAITGTAVYVGGHQRWMNNPNAQRLRRRRRGAAARHRRPRPGQRHAAEPGTRAATRAAPGRTSLLATAQGLYVGSDTDWIGNRKYFRGKIAFFPLAGGAAPASTAVQALPGGVYLGGPAGRPRPTCSTGSTPAAARSRPATPGRTGPTAPARPTSAAATPPAGARCRTWTRPCRRAPRARSSTASAGAAQQLDLPDPDRHDGQGAALLRQPVHRHRPASASGSSTSRSTAPRCCPRTTSSPTSATRPGP